MGKRDQIRHLIPTRTVVDFAALKLISKAAVCRSEMKSYNGFFFLQISIILFFQVAKATVTSIKLKKTLITYTRAQS